MRFPIETAGIVPFYNRFSSTISPPPHQKLLKLKMYSRESTTRLTVEWDPFFRSNTFYPKKIPRTEVGPKKTHKNIQKSKSQVIQAVPFWSPSLEVT